MNDARKVFDRMLNNNVVSWTAIINGYVQSGKGDEEAIKLFVEIMSGLVLPNHFTFSSILKTSANLLDLRTGEQVHSLAVKSGLASINCVGYSLIACTQSQARWKMPTNLLMFSPAVEVFDKMLEARIKPNEITYIAVLSACSHAGRSGSLVEALEFINSMPFTADELIWRTFLGACRVHGNIELGKHAARMIIEKNPHDSAAYSLLSNLYASTGLWEEVAKVRKDMKEKYLIKEAGSNWIEVKNKIHKFHVGDTSHPKAKEIYDELNQLGSKIKKLRYVPNTDYVLHDMEEQQKEFYLVLLGHRNQNPLECLRISMFAETVTLLLNIFRKPLVEK
ncbi:hypothetical protein DVH24_032091 [Malus domestica]|uniref:Uncharacterized protein n=1 Tax=Malus domestica TaxID=3750 RepID=A0A498J666_MALDO|nr:hypothetical protein DVH24_032091 [Malus domestica]